MSCLCILFIFLYKFKRKSFSEFLNFCIMFCFDLNLLIIFVETCVDFKLKVQVRQMIRKIIKKNCSWVICFLWMNETSKQVFYLWNFLELFMLGKLIYMFFVITGILLSALLVLKNIFLFSEIKCFVCKHSELIFNFVVS